MRATLSEEQTAIVAAIKSGASVVVDAVAGSGKTTTILGTAEAAPDKQFLVITYNRRLCDETRARIGSRDLTNIIMHTYHSSAMSFFHCTTHTDEGLQAIVSGTISAKPSATWNYDVLVVDEVQDMTPLYYQYVTKLIEMCQASGRQVQIMLLGDRHQEIYGFKGADSRFLTSGPSLYPAIKTPWVQLTLKTSYRVNRHMAAFVNTVMLKTTRIATQAHTNQERVRYYVADVFNSEDLNVLAKEAATKIQSCELRPDDVAFIAYSAKSSQTMQRIEKRLLAAKIPVHTPVSDDTSIDERAVAGKVLMCTMHQMKGLEREMIVVLGFDDWLCEKDVGGNVAQCSNLLYVACTRARKYLYVVQHYKKGPLPFVSIDELSLYRFVEVVGLRECEVGSVAADKPKKTVVGVRDLLKFIPAGVVSDAAACLELGERQKVGGGLALPDIVDSRAVKVQPGRAIAALRGSSEPTQLHELVADLNGIAIPAMFEQAATGRNTLIRSVLRCKVGRTTPARLESFQKRIACAAAVLAPADYAEAAALLDAVSSGYSARVEQLPNFKWLDTVNLKPAFDMLEAATDGKKTDYEVETEVEIGDYSIHGRIDLICTDLSGGSPTLWEIKCTRSFETEHLLQCAIYMYAYAAEHKLEGVQHGCVANLFTGEVQTVSATPDALRECIMVLLNEKYRIQQVADNEKFIAESGRLRAAIGTKKPACPIADDDTDDWS